MLLNFYNKGIYFMKAYVILITLVESEPLIWRQVIVPAGITFKRLHDVIQATMGWKCYHLYDFNINEEKLRITGDEEAIREYEFYSKKTLTKRNDPYGFIAKMLEIQPKLSTKVKIDKYLTEYKNIEYIYDFGDYWRHNIELEKIVEDYEYVYPICIDGEEACPPEDVGGVCGYKEFLKEIKDENHPEHESSKNWGESQNYKENFDIYSVNFGMEHTLKLKRIKKQEQAK